MITAIEDPVSRPFEARVGDIQGRSLSLFSQLREPTTYAIPPFREFLRVVLPLI